MQCPICENVHLQIADKQGVEIDYCPKCRGIWLDRGELEKIIERVAQDEIARQVPRDILPLENERRSDDRYRDSHYKDDNYRRDDRYDDRYRHKKKKSLLGELFDF